MSDENEKEFFKLLSEFPYSPTYQCEYYDGTPDRDNIYLYGEWKNEKRVKYQINVYYRKHESATA